MNPRLTLSQESSWFTQRETQFGLYEARLLRLHSLQDQHGAEVHSLHIKGCHKISLIWTFLCSVRRITAHFTQHLLLVAVGVEQHICIGDLGRWDCHRWRGGQLRIRLSIHSIRLIYAQMRRGKPLASTRRASGSGTDGGTNEVNVSSDSSGGTATSLRTRVAGVRVKKAPPLIPPIPTPSSTRVQERTMSTLTLPERRDQKIQSWQMLPLYLERM